MIVRSDILDMKRGGILFAVVSVVVVVIGAGAYMIYQSVNTNDTTIPFPILTLSTGVATPTSTLKAPTEQIIPTVSSSSSQQSLTQYTSTKFTGFVINYVDGWKFNREINDTNRMEIYLSSPKGSELKIILTPPETQGYFVDFPISDSCVVIGNTWNRCSAVCSTAGCGGIQLTSQRFFVKDGNKAGRTFMYTKDFTDIISKGLSGLFFQLTYSDVEGKTIADNLISSIDW